MRIGLVCPYDLSKPGGVQEQVFGLEAELRKQGDEPVVIGPGLPEDRSGVDLGPTFTVRGNRSKVPLSTDLGIKKKLSGLDVDLLHVHEPFMPTVSIAALRTGMPVVATFHAAPTGAIRRLYKLAGGLVPRLLGPNVKAVTAVSQSAAQPLGDLPLEIVPNGVDVSALDLDVERLSGRVAFLGRDEPRKGLDVLLEAWNVVKASQPEAELVVMGASRELDGVKWLGRVDDRVKAETLASSAIYVAPNTGGESFGIVLLEGMAAGAAVVASDLEAFRDVAESAASYFAVGSSTELARVLIELLSQPSQIARLAAAGRERVESFDWPEIAGRYRQIYVAALS